MVAHVCDHVRIADLGGYVGVDGDLAKFRIDPVHALEFGTALRRATVDALEHIPGLGVAFANENHVWIKHVANDSTERDELRIIAQTEVRTHCATRCTLKRLPQNTARRTRHNSGSDNHIVIADLVMQCGTDALKSGDHIIIAEKSVRPTWRRDDDESDVRRKHCLPHVGRRPNALTMLGDQRLELRLGNWRYTTID